MADSVDVEALLHDGEVVEESADAGAGELVVTSHRVVAATPELSGANVAYADRPNVEGIERDARGGTAHLERCVKATVVGFALLAMGLVVDLEGLLAGASVDSSTASQTGVGGVLAFLEGIRTALALLDDAMLVAGALATAIGLGFLGLFLEARERVVVVEVAGGDDLRVDASVDGDALADVQRHLHRK